MRLVRYILPSSYVISKCWLQETAHKKEKQFLWSNIDSSSQKEIDMKDSSYLKTLFQLFRCASLIFFHINLHPINIFLRCLLKMFTVVIWKINMNGTLKIYMKIFIMNLYVEFVCIIINYHIFAST